MTSHLLWLQLPFLYLPMLVVGLAIYGADFEHPSGEIYQWTPLILVLLHWTLTTFGRVLARRAVAAPILIVAACLVAVAYRPLHMGWWDERSTNQALWVLAMGVCSVVASHIGALRVSESGGPRIGLAAGAFAVFAVLGASAMLYPLFPLLTLAPLFATGAALAPEPFEAARDTRQPTHFGGWQRYGAMLLGMELSLPLWDFQTDPRWALSLGLGLAGMGLGVYCAHRRPVASSLLPALAAVAVIASAFASSLVVAHWRTVLVGAAAGWLLRPLFEAPSRRGAPTRLGWVTPLWLFGMVLGFALSANRSFLGLRLLLWLPPAWLLVRHLIPPRELRTRTD